MADAPAPHEVLQGVIDVLPSSISAHGLGQLPRLSLKHGKHLLHLCNYIRLGPDDADY